MKYDIKIIPVPHIIENNFNVRNPSSIKLSNNA